MAYLKNDKHELIETFKKFSDLYRSKLEFTGEKLRRISNFGLPIDPRESITYTETNEIAIKMPEDEFERFLKDFGKCVDLYKSARENPMIREQLNQLTMLVELYK